MTHYYYKPTKMSFYRSYFPQIFQYTDMLNKIIKDAKNLDGNEFDSYSGVSWPIINSSIYQSSTKYVNIHSYIHEILNPDFLNLNNHDIFKQCLNSWNVKNDVERMTNDLIHNSTSKIFIHVVGNANVTDVDFKINFNNLGVFNYLVCIGPKKCINVVEIKKVDWFFKNVHKIYGVNIMDMYAGGTGGEERMYNISHIENLCDEKNYMISNRVYAESSVKSKIVIKDTYHIKSDFEPFYYKDYCIPVFIRRLAFNDFFDSYRINPLVEMNIERAKIISSTNI